MMRIALSLSFGILNCHSLKLFTRLPSIPALLMPKPVQSNLLPLCCTHKVEDTETTPADETVNIGNIVDGAANATIPSNETIVDPNAQFLKMKEELLQSQIQQIESYINLERQNLLRVKDKVSESGKTGYFIVQAQVADFLKRKDAEQKERVKANKREFVSKMLPVIDSFRQAAARSPPATEREANMHKNFGSLLEGLLIVFDKFGVKEFRAEIGSKYDPHRHEIVDTVFGTTGGLIALEVNPGLLDQQDVLRKAKVVVTKTETPEENPAETQVEAPTDESAVGEDGDVTGADF